MTVRDDRSTIVPREGSRARVRLGRWCGCNARAGADSVTRVPRSRWVRLVATWLACWLPLVLADGGWLHACPMHDGAGLNAVTTMAAPAHVSAHAPAHGMLVAHAGRDGHSGHHAGAHLCTCLGACCASLAVLPVGPAPIAFVAVERAAVAPTGRPQHEYVASWVDFVLPFATAPPA